MLLSRSSFYGIHAVSSTDHPLVGRTELVVTSANFPVLSKIHRGLNADGMRRLILPLLISIKRCFFKALWKIQPSVIRECSITVEGEIPTIAFCVSVGVASGSGAFLFCNESAATSGGKEAPNVCGREEHSVIWAVKSTSIMFLISPAFRIGLTVRPPIFQIVHSQGIRRRSSKVCFLLLSMDVLSSLSLVSMYFLFPLVTLRLRCRRLFLLAAISSVHHADWLQCCIPESWLPGGLHFGASRHRTSSGWAGGVTSIIL